MPRRRRIARERSIRSPASARALTRVMGWRWQPSGPMSSRRPDGAREEPTWTPSRSPAQMRSRSFLLRCSGPDRRSCSSIRADRAVRQCGDRAGRETAAHRRVDHQASTRGDAGRDQEPRQGDRRRYLSNNDGMSAFGQCAEADRELAASQRGMRISVGMAKRSFPSPAGML